MVKRRTTSLARRDALLEILGPDWHAAFSGDLANMTPLRFLAAGYADPHTVATRTFPPDPVLPTPLPWCLGRTRGDTIIAAAKATLELWGDELELADLADDIAIEARLALTLTQEI